MSSVTNIKAFVRRSFRKKKDHAPKTEKVVKCYTDEEEAKIVELKELVKSDLSPRYTDTALVGFLKARSWNVQDAEKLFMLDINLRRLLESFETEKCCEIPRVSEMPKFTGSIGYDKEGCFVRVLNVGYADLKGLVHSSSTLEMLNALVLGFDDDYKLLMEENKKTGRRQEKVLLIANLEEIKLADMMYKPVFDSVVLGAKLMQDHYHGFAKAIYIINAPSFFPSVFKLIKPVLQDSFQKILRIFDSEGWKEELLKIIDADVLPAYLGGTRVDCNNDPRCSDLIGYGGTIPESYYAPSDFFLDPEDPDVITATVNAGSFYNYRLTLSTAGTKCFWHIQAKDNDIGLAIFFEPRATGVETPRTLSRKKRDEDMSRLEQLTPVIRTQCQISPEVGSGVFWKAGTIVIHFDNTYSWMNSKVVYFKLRVERRT